MSQISLCYLLHLDYLGWLGLTGILTIYGLYQIWQVYQPDHSLHQATAGRLYHATVCRLYHATVCRLYRLLANRSLKLVAINLVINRLLEIGDYLRRLQNLIPMISVKWADVSPLVTVTNDQSIITNVQIRTVQDQTTHRKLIINQPFDDSCQHLSSPTPSRLLIDVSYRVQNRDYLITWNLDQISSAYPGLPLRLPKTRLPPPWMQWTRAKIYPKVGVTIRSQLELEKEIITKMNQYLGPETNFHSTTIQMKFDDLDLPHLADIVSLELESNLGDKLAIGLHEYLDIRQLTDD